MEEHKVGKESATDLLECVRLSEMPQKVLNCPLGRAEVLKAMGESAGGVGLSTHGKNGERGAALCI